MFSTDVGGEQGIAQYRPREPPARQKILFAGFFPFGKGEADEKRHQQIARDGDQVEGVQRGQCEGLGRKSRRYGGGMNE